MLVASGDISRVCQLRSPAGGPRSGSRSIPHRLTKSSLTVGSRGTGPHVDQKCRIRPTDANPSSLSI